MVIYTHIYVYIYISLWTHFWKSAYESRGIPWFTKVFPMFQKVNLPFTHLLMSGLRQPVTSGLVLGIMSRLFSQH